MQDIRLEGVTKVYPNGVKAVDSVDLEIQAGEFMVLVGPSGCGKSTLLRTIAGLEGMTEGTVWIGDRDVSELPPRARDIAMVFQSYALYPHMTVRENLGFGLKVRKMPREDMRRQVDEVARVLGLHELMDRTPAQLSGGQRQRVAMGRAMVRNPQAYLMDEPLSNLDAKLRVSLRAELLRLHERLGVTTVYVTHDQVEAMTLGQRVAVLRDGVLQQCASPHHLFRRPANLFVASFIGSPAMNLVEAVVRRDTVEFAEHVLALSEGSPLRGAERRVILGVRPTDFDLAGPTTDPSLPRMRVRPELIEELGAENNVIFPVDAPWVVTEVERAAAAREDESGLEGHLLADSRVSLFTARLDLRQRISVGETIELAVDNSRFHFFDPEDGRAIDGEEPSRRVAAAQSLA
jgi:multiple sugar transport system ATP-binding protein